MKRLILIRHAKSSWASHSLHDHDRPLNARGRDACIRVAGWLEGQGLRPDEVLCSTALRCQETYARISAAMGLDVEAEPCRALYHASAPEMLAVLRAAQGQTVMMLGHNPGIADFAARLHAIPPENADFARYPTAATTLIGFDVRGWSALRFGMGESLGFGVWPR